MHDQLRHTAVKIGRVGATLLSNGVFAATLKARTILNDPLQLIRFEAIHLAGRQFLQASPGLVQPSINAEISSLASLAIFSGSSREGFQSQKLQHSLRLAEHADDSGGGRRELDVSRGHERV